MRRVAPLRSVNPISRCDLIINSGSDLVIRRGNSGLAEATQEQRGGHDLMIKRRYERLGTSGFRRLSGIAP